MTFLLYALTHQSTYTPQKIKDHSTHTCEEWIPLQLIAKHDQLYALTHESPYTPQKSKNHSTHTSEEWILLLSIVKTPCITQSITHRPQTSKSQSKHSSRSKAWISLHSKSWVSLPTRKAWTTLHIVVKSGPHYTLLCFINHTACNNKRWALSTHGSNAC